MKSTTEKLLTYVDRLSQRTKLFSHARELVEIYDSKRIPRAAAALSYYLTLSIFPTLICIYTIVMNVVPGLNLTMEDFEGIIPESALHVIIEYLKYVSLHNDRTMITAGIIGMVTSSAAAFRTINSVMADVQGKSRYQGFFTLIFSFLFSVLFLLAIYFAAIVMVSGNWVMLKISSVIPIFDAVQIWQTMKYPLLFVVFVLILYAMYKLTAPKGVKGPVLPGAALAAVLLVIVSYFFSIFINVSTRYQLIYSSLASIIIVMIWMYACSIILIMCNILNVLLRGNLSNK